MGKLRSILPCFLLAFVLAVCHGNPLYIESPEEVNEDNVFIEVTDDSGVESESTTTDQQLVDDLFKLQVLSGEEENTFSSDVVKDGDDNESNGEAVTTNNYVSKGVPSEGKSIIYNSIYANTGYPTNGVTVSPYTALDKLVSIQCPGGFQDVIMVPISASTEVFTMGNRMVIGDMAYCKNPGELVLFNGNQCSIRTNFQGRAGSQQLNRRICRVLRKEMHVMQEEADELAENLEMGVQNVQNFANSFGQNFPYGSANPSGNGWSLGPNNNQFGSGNPLGTNYNSFGTYKPSLGTKPLAGTNTSPLISNNPFAANSFSSNLGSFPYGNTYPNSNASPFGSYSTVGNINNPAYAASNTPIFSNSYTSPLLDNSNAQSLNNYNTQGLDNYNTQALNNYNTYPSSNTNGQVLNNLNTKVTNTNTLSGDYTPLNTKTGAVTSGNSGKPYNAPLDATNIGGSNTNQKPKPSGTFSTQSTNGLNDLTSNWLQ